MTASKTTKKKVTTPRRDYLTSNEKKVLMESLNKIIVRFRKKRDSLRPGSYDRSYIKDTIEHLEKAHNSFGNIW